MAFRRIATVAVLLAGTLGLAACGESSEEKATAQVCSSTKEIQAQIAKLQTLPLSTSSVSEARVSFEAIDKSVGRIKEAAPNLEAARKEEVAAAEREFQTSLAPVAAKVASTALSSGDVEAELKQDEAPFKDALATLAADYKKIYQELKCS